MWALLLSIKKTTIQNVFQSHFKKKIFTVKEMNEGVFTYTTASIMRQACSTHGIQMVGCTDLDLSCAPQRLLRRGGEADLEEKRGKRVNETLSQLATHKTERHSNESFPKEYCRG